MITLKEHNVKPYGELCAMLAKVQKCAYVAATGTGKSYVVGKYIEDYGYEQDTLVLLPNNAIKDGWKSILPKIQTMTYTALSRKPIDAKKYKVIVCDEMHHLGAILWGRICREVMEGFDGIIIGISATPIRFLDQCRDMTIEFFDGNVVEGLDLPQAISAGILPSFEYVSSLFNMPSFTPSQRDKITESLVERLDFMNSVYSFKSILRKHLSDGNHKVAVFASHIGKIEEIRELCSEVFPDASHYIFHSKLKQAESRKALEEFSEDSNMSFIYTVDMLSEGVHIKGVDCVIMFRKTESPILYLQQLGRAMNTDMAGRRVKILDFVANHTNLRVLQENGSSVMEWIRNGISNPKSQIVVSDYTVEETELLDKINMILHGYWLPEEDDILRSNYGDGHNMDGLVCLLPRHTRRAIKQHAALIGLVKPKKDLEKEGVYKAVKELYLLDDGPARLAEMFPDVPYPTIRDIARQFGLQRRPSQRAWTQEEEEIIRSFCARKAGMFAISEAIDRSLLTIYTHSQKMGIDDSQLWGEKEDQILLENSEASNADIRKKHFHTLELYMIQKRRVALGVANEFTWSQEKIELFQTLYRKGGPKLVAQHKEFADLTQGSLYRCAGKYGVTKRKQVQAAWTEDEIKMVEDYLDIPRDERPTARELSAKIPRHTFSGVRNKIRNLGLQRKTESSQ